MALLAMTPLVSADLKEDYFAACAAGETDVVAKALKEDPGMMRYHSYASVTLYHDFCQWIIWNQTASYLTKVHYGKFCDVH